MGISNFTLQRIFDSIHSDLIDAKIERIINISDNDYLLSLFKDGKTSNLLLSLDPSLPIIIKSNSFKIDACNIANYQCNMLKKYFDHGTIIDAYKIQNDRIVVFDVKKWTPSYQLIESKLIFELFPLSPNIIITNNEFEILDAFKKSESLDSKHPIYKGLKYSFPSANDKSITIDSKVDDLQGKINKSELKYLSSLSDTEYKKALSNMLSEKDYYLYKKDVSSIKINDEAIKVTLDNLYQNLIEIKTLENKENKYAHVFKLVEQKIKSCKKRLINLEKDKEKFLNCDHYQEKGTLLYLGEETYKRGDKEIIIDGVKIALDEKLDLHQNAQRYFKLYKKAKSGLVQVEIQTNNAKEELAYFERILLQLHFASNVDMQEILLDLAENHYLKLPKLQQRSKKQPSNKKYTPHFIKYKDNKIGYGLSSYQNEELTFSLAHKDDIYLHIKDFHGPHVIIFNDNPSEDVLRFAGEVSLYFANKTAGEVYYTRRKNVKKVPSQRGLVTMKDETIMVINNIREESLSILKRI